MKFGVFIFGTEYTMSLPALGRAAEERGFESLFVPEHTHIPASRESPWPGGPRLPMEYSHCLDPFVALGAVAAVTSKLRLGTGICLVVEHEPIALAKQIASLDVLSNGRFLFGIGAGWNLEEMRNHGTDPSHRFKLMRERVQAMRQIWTADEASYHGDFVNFDRIWAWPKPTQRPYPPVIIGGDGPNTLKRVADYGDEWMPIVGRAGVVEERLSNRITELNQLAAARGRGPIPVSTFGARPKPESIEGYRAAGVSRCIFMLPPAGESEVMASLDRLAPLVQEFSESVGV
ncbi:MAG: LLM class F420-dependent oxidoreductase [Dehalococcoidia bacterium]